MVMLQEHTTVMQGQQLCTVVRTTMPCLSMSQPQFTLPKWFWELFKESLSLFWGAFYWVLLGAQLKFMLASIKLL